MNIKNLNLKDFKRNIAIILLAGLLLSLFGSFSYLIGMETAVIKDFTGQIVQLDDAQKTALRGCETLKQMIEDTGIQEVPFEGVAPFITNQNFQHLAQLIKDKRYLNQVQQNQDCIELFKFADYMKAPQEARSVLAERIYEPLRAKIKDTVDENEKFILELLFETVESNLSYYPDFSSLLKDKRELRIERIEITGDVGISMSSGQKLGKKLKSLDGIEALSDQAWTHKVKDLRIEGHEMPRVDFDQIKQAFPAVNHVLLKDNQLRHISNINASNAAIDLKNNPIESIIIDNPRTLKNTRIFVDKNARPMITFNQSRFDKCAQWLEALKAQSTVALGREHTKKSAIRGCMFGLGAVGIAITLNWFSNENFYKENNMSPLDLVKRLAPFSLGGISFVGSVSALASIWEQRNQIRYELAVQADRDGDHVNVCWTEPYHHGNTRTVVTHSCPSKYAYNLFGKN